MRSTSERPDHTTDRPETAGSHRAVRPTPMWYKIVMFGLMLVGLLWVIVFYISGDAALPIPPIGNWNILIGFGLMMIGFLMTVGWR